MDWIFSAATIKRLIYLLLITGAAFYLQSQCGLAQGYWLVWSTLLLSLTTTQYVIYQRLAVILMAGVVTSLLTAIAGVIAWSLPLLITFTFIIICVGTYAVQRYEAKFRIIFIPSLLVLIAVTHPVNTDDNMHRMLFILVGAVLAGAGQLIMLPYFVRDEWRDWMRIVLHKLEQLNNRIFDCLLQPEYVNNEYFFERRVHDAKIEYLRALQSLREVSNIVVRKQPEEARHNLTRLLEQIDLIFNTIIDCGQIRARNTDHTTFAVCGQDLLQIKLEIAAAFAAVTKIIGRNINAIDLTTLDDKIIRFEQTYQHVLQVSAPEPLVFLFLINGLKALTSELSQFCQMEVVCAI